MAEAGTISVGDYVKTAHGRGPFRIVEVDRLEVVAQITPVYQQVFGFDYIEKVDPKPDVEGSEKHPAKPDVIEEERYDSPCVCGLPEGHLGLHVCREECGGEWVGGRPKPQVSGSNDNRVIL